ncbi:MAG: hypothetical protein A2Z32_10160 [Chloroflexi bacterium RBG_16_69_14]|nr:MAG: hypothetical protein A2Z32_10160 [Chloroflexi bacterium RBG_16_69_14]
MIAAHRDDERARPNRHGCRLPVDEIGSKRRSRRRWSLGGDSQATDRAGRPADNLFEVISSTRRRRRAGRIGPASWVGRC